MATDHVLSCNLIGNILLLSRHVVRFSNGKAYKQYNYFYRKKLFFYVSVAFVIF